jgi:P pilus assembly chaperone PapD
MQLKILLAALAVANFAHASSFNISPIRAELSGAHHTDVMTLTNADDGPVVVEVRVVKWSQDNGADQLDDTRELLVTPPVLQIPGKGEQIIRVALRREPDPTRETTYRVIFQEVPQAATPDFTGLRVALRLSVPIFVAPSRGKAQADVAWDAHWLPSGDARSRRDQQRQRSFTGHRFRIAIARRGRGARPHGQVLAGRQPHGVDLSAAGGRAKRWRDFTIHGHSDQGEFSADVANNGS